jgi:hypothetical protein
MPIYQAPLLVWDFLASSVNVSVMPVRMHSKCLRFEV